MAKPAVNFDENVYAQKKQSIQPKQMVFDYELQLYQKMQDYKRNHSLLGTRTNLQ